MTQMSADSLKTNLSNPAKDYLWDVMFAAPLGGDTETLMIRAQSTEMPERGVGAISVKYKQTAGIKFPGKAAFPQTWAVTFIEGEDRAIFNAMNDWLNTIVDARAGTGAIVVKTNVELHLLNTDGSTALQIRLVGCYPETVASVPLAYESEASIMYPVTFSYDFWEKV